VLDFYGRDPLSVSESVEPEGVKKAFLNGAAPAAGYSFHFNRGRLPFRCGRHLRDASRGSAHAGHRLRRFRLRAPIPGDPLLGDIVTRQRGLRIPLTPEPWEALAWAIIGQQISLKAAVTLRRELIGAVGECHPTGLRAHPTAEAVANLNVDTLRGLKFSGSKAEYLLAAARAVASGELPLPALREMSALRGARLLGQIRE